MGEARFHAPVRLPQRGDLAGRAGSVQLALHDGGQPLPAADAERRGEDASVAARRAGSSGPRTTVPRSRATSKPSPDIGWLQASQSIACMVHSPLGIIGGPRPLRRGASRSNREATVPRNDMQQLTGAVPVPGEVW